MYIILYNFLKLPSEKANWYRLVIRSLMYYYNSDVYTTSNKSIEIIFTMLEKLVEYYYL